MPYTDMFEKGLDRVLSENDFGLPAQWLPASSLKIGRRPVHPAEKLDFAEFILPGSFSAAPLSLSST